jgi:hypothetical protein
VQQVIEAIRSGKVGDYREARYSNVKFLSEEGLVRFMRRDSNWAYQLVSQINLPSVAVVDVELNAAEARMPAAGE